MQFLKRMMKPFLKKKADQDLEDEVRFHLAKQIEINVAAGMPLAEARRRALIEFGGVQKTKEDVREQRWTHAGGVLLQDARYAWRMFRKSPGFTAVAVLTLALGIGMNTAIFSLIDAVLFRSLPASHPEELVMLRWHARHQPKLHSHSSNGDCSQKRSGDDGYGCSLSLPFLNEVRSQNLFSGLAAFSGAPRLDVSGNGAATIVNSGQLVSGDFFSTLGVKTAVGRAFSPGDDTPTAEPAVMLSYGYWQSAFGGAPDAVGRTIRLNGLPFMIVGVVDKDFTGLTPGRQFDLWLPMSAHARLDPRWNPKEDDAGSWWLVIVGRTKPGVSAKQAQAALSLLFRNEALHEQKPLFSAADEPGIDVLPAQQGLEGGRARTLQPLYVLMLAVALVLVIACANIAGLLLARAAGRSREIAVRLVLGAKRARLVSQLLVESLLLSAMGGALGLFIAHWGTLGLMALSNNTNGSGPPPFTPHLDVRVLAFTAVTAVLTGLFFGLIPAFRSLRVDLTPALKSGAGTSAATASGTKWYSLGNLLVVAQVSLAVVALVTAGLLVRTLSNLKNVNLGFDTNNVLVFSIDPTLAGYKGPKVAALNRDLQEQFAALPGVTSVSYSWAPLLAGSEWDTDIHLPGTSESEKANADYMPVGPGFFQTMRIPMKAGRDLSGADFAAAAVRSARAPGAPDDPRAAPITVVVNETFVRRFFPRADPLGQHIDQPLPEDAKDPRGAGYDIVGVVGDAKYDSLRREISPTMYTASGGSGGAFSVRTAGEPLQMVPVVRDMITHKDSNLAMFRISTESQQIDRLVFLEQLVARLATFFGLLAVVLACIGLYGLLSYEVTRRTREIGIRMAIGAQRSNVIRLVVVQGIVLAAAGAVVGIAASLGVSRLLKSMLYGVNPGDPLTLAFCAGMLLVVALAACYLPARRATKVDPLVALRYE